MLHPVLFLILQTIQGLFNSKGRWSERRIRTLFYRIHIGDDQLGGGAIENNPKDV
ncbi:hypothetical protein D3C73_721550 [compost metagenome]